MLFRSRNNLKTLSSSYNLPEEVVKVDLIFKDTETGITTPLELWAGFIGLEQNMNNNALTPKIGWMIRKKDVEQVGLKQKYENELQTKGKLAIKVKEIPKVIFELKEIKEFSIEFIDKIIIPDKLAELKINKLYLSGQTNKKERGRIQQLLPNTEVIFEKYSFEVSIESVTKDTQSPNLLIVKGKVLDDYGTKEPLPGASIFVKGTTTGTSTDAKGNFSIKVEQGDTLEFTYIGYDRDEVIVSKEMIDK